MTLPIPASPGNTAITGPVGGHQLEPNADGSINAVGSFAPAANQRVNAQANDFVAGSIVDLAALLTLAGASGDANTIASFMGRLTKIRDLLAATLTVQGTITEANSAGILADLATLVIQTLTPNVSDRWARQVGQVDVARYNGAAVSSTNPQFTQDNLRALILAGKGYTAITKQTSGGAGNFGVALYNPSTNAKTVVIYSIRIYCNQSAAVHEVHLGTTDPVFGNALTPANNNAGNGTASGCTASYASATQAIAGTLIAWQAQNTNATQELMSNGEVIVLPSGANNSVAVYVVLGAGGGWGAEIGYVEY